MMELLGAFVASYFTYCLLVVIATGLWILHYFEMQEKYDLGFRHGHANGYATGWEDGVEDRKEILGEAEVAGPRELE